MPTAHLQRPLKLDRPAATVIGDRVSLVQVHLSLFPTPTIHIGYGVSNGGAPVAKTETLAISVEELATRFPQAGPKLDRAIQEVIDGAYEFLVEAGIVGSGVRT